VIAVISIVWHFVSWMDQQIYCYYKLRYFIIIFFSIVPRLVVWIKQKESMMWILAK